MDWGSCMVCILLLEALMLTPSIQPGPPQIPSPTAASVLRTASSTFLSSAYSSCTCRQSDLPATRRVCVQAVSQSVLRMVDTTRRSVSHPSVDATGRLALPSQVEATWHSMSRPLLDATWCSNGLAACHVWCGIVISGGGYGTFNIASVG